MSSTSIFVYFSSPVSPKISVTEAFHIYPKFLTIGSEYSNVYIRPPRVAQKRLSLLGAFEYLFTSTCKLLLVPLPMLTHPSMTVLPQSLIRAFRKPICYHTKHCTYSPYLK